MTPDPARDFASLVYAAPASIMVHDFEGRILFANQKCRDLHGYSAEEWATMNLERLYAPESGSWLPQRFQEIRRHGTATFNVYHLRRNGSVFPLHVVARSLDWDGQPAVINIATDAEDHHRANEAARLGEENFHAIANHTVDWESWVAPDGRLRWVNPGVERLTGYTPAECMAMPDYPLPMVAEADREMVRQSLVEARLGRRGGIFDFRIAAKDRRLRWGELAWQPIHDAKGRPVGFRASVRDITVRKQAEEALQQSEAMFRALVENASDVVYTLDSRFLITYASPNWQESVGETPSEALGQSIEPYIHPADHARFREFVRMVAHTEGRKDSVVYRIQRKDGTWRWHASTISLLRDAAGAPDSFVGIARDVTEQKEAEQALAASEKRLRGMIDASPIGIGITDNRGVMVEANEALANILGYERSDLLAQNFEEFTHPDDFEREWPMIEALWTGQATGYRLDKRFLHQDGHMVWVDLQCSLVRDEEGRPLFGFVFVEDITERKRLEEVRAFLLESASSPSGDFFGRLVRFLGPVLDMELVVVGRVGADGRTVHLVASNSEAVSEDLESYSLDGSPCETLAGHAFRAYPQDVRRMFPGRRVLDQLEAESYVGATLWGFGGQPLGYLYAIDRKVLANTRLAESVLNLVAPRAAAEMEWAEAERVLKESEERFRSLLQNVDSVAVQGYRADGTIQYWNRGSEQIYGYAAAEAVGSNLLDRIVPPEDHEEVRQTIDRMAANRKPASSGEHPMRRRDASPVTVYSSHAIVEVPGREIEFFRIDLDLTKLRQAEQEYRMLFNTMLGGVAVHEIIVNESGRPIDYRFLSVNPAFERMTGLRAEDIIGRTVLEVMPDTESSWIETYGHVALTGKPVHFENYSQPLGRYFEVTAFRPRPHQFAAVFIDSTERHLAEEGLRASREQLRALAGRLQSVREEERTRVAREIHDVLAQELTRLKIDLVWLHGRLTRIDKPTALETLVDRVVEMKDMADSSIRSVQGIAATLRPAVLDSLGLCAAIEWLAQDVQEHTELKCRVHLPEEEVPVEKEVSTATFRIVQESITNVLRHAEATEAHIRLRFEAGKIRLEITDNGRGLPPDKLADPLSLGLVGMRERALLLGGQFDIRSEPGQGTTVAVRLPATQPDSPHRDAP